MPYNCGAYVLVNSNVEEKTATLLKIEKTFFQRNYKVLSIEDKVLPG
jgi:hypothetical protein